MYVTRQTKQELRGNRSVYRNIYYNIFDIYNIKNQTYVSATILDMYRLIQRTITEEKANYML
jgi:hypothetical protein